MTFSAAVIASIPSPSISTFQLGPVTIHIYALCLLTGIIAAALITNRRLTARGAEPWVVIDIALLAVPLAIIGARIFHVLTHPDFYFGEGKDFWAVFRIWEGGIAIFGALIGGAIGAWLGCKWTGVRFWSFADALAPGMLVAQALGRFGNWFNQELFGGPTDLPWGLEIDYPNAAWPEGVPEGTLFHPTFLYEMLWNLLGALVIVWAARRFTLQWGRAFALYLIWYGAGRLVWESMRIDPSEEFFGIRTNVWAAFIAVLLGLVIFFVQRRRHLGLEPSPYTDGRRYTAAGVVQSQDTDEFVDVSAPPTPENIADAATSTVATK